MNNLLNLHLSDDLSCSYHSEKGAYGFSAVMRANDLDDIIYDVRVGNAKHASQTF